MAHNTINSFFPVDTYDYLHMCNASQPRAYHIQYPKLCSLFSNHVHLLVMRILSFQRPSGMDSSSSMQLIFSRYSSIQPPTTTGRASPRRRVPPLEILPIRLGYLVPPVKVEQLLLKASSLLRNGTNQTLRDHCLQAI